MGLLSLTCGLLAGCGGTAEPAAAAPAPVPAPPPPPPPPPAPPAAMPVFLMAGQSNMVGNVDTPLYQTLLTELNTGAATGQQQRLVADLRYWYFDTNNGYASYGYSDTMAAYEAAELVRLRSAGLVGSNLMQPHAKVMCAMNEAAPAPLGANCGNPFGPELVMGHALAKTLTTPTSLVKVAVGGTTLQVDWRPPRSGAPVGPQYLQLRARIQSLRLNAGSVHPDCVARTCRWGAFVWFQGENDSFDSVAAQNYEQNLRHLIADVRSEVGDAALPVVVVQVGPWAQSLAHGRTVAAAQQAVVRADAQARLVETSDLSGFYHYDPAAQLIIGERVAKAVQGLLGTTE